MGGLRPMSDVAATPDAKPSSARYYLLFMLLLVYTSNFIDRTIIGTLAQPIKEDLRLADWQLGLVSGLAFALFYSLLGLPIGRFADKFNRVTIISLSLAVWSLMTAVCGMAQNFLQLLLARAGVGIGEAGCSPPAHSLIADSFPREQRATALGIYSLGIPIGALFGALAGGWIAQEYGWRMAFVLVGLPGVVLAILMKFTVREPGRGVFDAQPAEEAPPYSAVLKRIFTDPGLVLLFASFGLISFAGFGLVVFAVPFLLRGFDLTLVEAAGAYGLIHGAAAAIGTASGGFVSDAAARRNDDWRLLTPAIGLLIAGPLFAIAFQLPTLIVIGAFAAVAVILRDLHTGPMLGVLHNSVSPRMRARATALLLVVMSLFGLGFGPLFVGWLSDVAAHQLYAGVETYASQCPAGVPGHGAPPVAAAACTTASFEGLKLALTTTVCLYTVSGVLLWLANRSLRARAAA